MSKFKNINVRSVVRSMKGERFRAALGGTQRELNLSPQWQGSVFQRMLKQGWERIKDFGGGKSLGEKNVTRGVVNWNFA